GHWKSPFGGDDCARISKGIQEPLGSDSRRQHGSHGSGQTLRPLSRRSVPILRSLVDSRLHDSLHHERLAHGKDWHPPGAAKTFFQSSKGKRKAGSRGDKPGTKASCSTT